MKLNFLRKNTFWILLRTAVILLLGHVIYSKFKSIPQNLTVSGLSKSFLDPETIFILCTILILSYFNWLFEVKKWNLLVTPGAKEASHWNTILVGNLLGVITPGRIGEYAGRALLSKNISKPQAIYANFICSLGQNTSNFLVGLPLMYLLISKNEIFGKNIDFSLFFISILGCIILLFSLFNQHVLIAWLKNLRQLNILGQLYEFIPHQKVIGRLLVWSLIRYFVYALQYYLVLTAFCNDLDPIYALSGIGTIYIYKSLLPLPSAFGLILRVQLAILVWGGFSVYMNGIIISSLILWIFNQFIPALMGLPSFWNATRTKNEF